VKFNQASTRAAHALSAKDKSQIHREVWQANPLSMIQSTGLWLSLFIAEHDIQVLNKPTTQCRK